MNAGRVSFLISVRNKTMETRCALPSWPGARTYVLGPQKTSADLISLQTLQCTCITPLFHMQCTRWDVGDVLCSIQGCKTAHYPIHETSVMDESQTTFPLPFFRQRTVHLTYLIINGGPVTIHTPYSLHYPARAHVLSALGNEQAVIFLCLYKVSSGVTHKCTTQGVNQVVRIAI